MENLQALKQRFGIIGNDIHLNRALEKAVRVAPTDISVLVTGESGVGKESIPKIIHSLSHRKHAKYIAVNCGAIPEGTIDSELFGHEKGAFTGATQDRKGYFEVTDGGTIFLDEVGELPLTTQVRLLRVLENGEFIKVGSSKVLKTNVRIVAATNVNMQSAIEKEKFREDLYYRLSTVEIHLPALRDRNEDIHLLFRKFASDFAQKYRMPSIRLDENAVTILLNYRFPWNIRQLKNLAINNANIKFLGWKSKNEIIEYYRNSSALIVPSQMAKNGDCEGLPTVILEGINYQTPIIATNHAGIPEIIKDKQTGFICKENDEDELIKTILKFLSYENTKEIIFNAKKELSLHFDAIKQSEKLQNLFINND